jgi:predicted AlkP superfamily pyrophosphatase or phosphodiesterase
MTMVGRARAMWRAAIVSVFGVLVAVETAGAASGPAPKLVVVLVVDQMRGDYVDRYSYQWTAGLHRLITEGAWFRRAAFPYMTTVTCVGHATISTGALPTTHGIVGNSWFDRTAGRSLACTTDPSATPITYAGPAAGNYGPARLFVPTLADEMRAQLTGPTRVVTMSMKARTAIMLAGHGGDAVTWFNQASHGFMTSAAYASAPVPFVAQFVKANPIEPTFGKDWTLQLLPDRYAFADDADGEKPPVFWKKAFPHAIKGRGDTPDQSYYEAWEESPFSDAYLGRMAVAAVDAMKMGQGAGTDFLGISFSALDLVGHDFGPRSFEVQDVLAHLDQTIGVLLAHLDRTVGAGRYVVALSADHGVAPIPEQMKAFGVNAGRQGAKAAVDAAQKSLETAFGPDQYTVRLLNNDIYLDGAVVDKLRANPAALQNLLASLRALPGVAAAYFGDALDTQAAAGDHAARAALASYVSGRNGDIVVVPRPYWFFVLDDGSAQPGDGTSHGSPYDYDQHVPLMFFGAGIKRGEYLRPASPVDLAPTLAFLCGVTLPRPDGEVLTDVIATGPAPVARPAAAKVPSAK